MLNKENKCLNVLHKIHQIIFKNGFICDWLLVGCSGIITDILLNLSKFQNKTSECDPKIKIPRYMPEGKLHLRIDPSIIPQTE